MENYLESDKLIVRLNSFGAEYTSIKEKKDNCEYLWQANPKYWKRHAPVLFPIVGRVKDDLYKIDGKTFYMNQHGFARDMEFDLIDKNECSLTYCLDSDKVKIENYPYKFKLYTKYTLYDNELEIKYTIVNTDGKEIFFSIGSHPAFMCPLFEKEEFENYYIEFEKNETAEREFLDKNLRLYTGKKEIILNNSNVLNLTKGLFESDAVVLTKFNSKKVFLKSKTNNKCICVNLKDFKYLAIWSKTDDAPFVCIEPWLGRADFTDTDHNYKKKDEIIKLNINEKYECSYSISII
ncbi:MAG: aldose 1-epimerase family protein [Fusobacteriaceae bacterium]|nr:aldose 1-epimerase family protein [Fusobacteriaceae bacterium]